MTRHRTPGRRPSAGSVLALDGIRSSWDWLCVPPHPVTVPGAEIPGLPDRRIALDELRVLLLDPATAGAVRDDAWRYLISRSRVDGATWTVACAGMALPMLARVFRECVARGAGDRDDIASAAVAGFVAGLAGVDLDRGGIASSLRWAALRGGLGVVREALDLPAALPHDELVAHTLGITPPADGHGGAVARVVAPGSAPPPVRSGHPDLVLAAAVADGVLTTGEADLIGETRLQRVPLAEIAARAGCPVGTVTMRRLRAEMRLVAHLLTPDGSDEAGDTGGAPRPAGRAVSRPVPDPAAGQRPVRPAPGSADLVVSGRGGSRAVTGRRRRRTRGARRASTGQVTR